jgi:hypothetical protein
MISLCRTIWMNPGYFPSPLELENKIILKNSRFKNKYELNFSNPKRADKRTILRSYIY